MKTHLLANSLHHITSACPKAHSRSYRSWMRSTIGIIFMIAVAIFTAQPCFAAKPSIDVFAATDDVMCVTPTNYGYSTRGLTARVMKDGQPLPNVEVTFTARLGLFDPSTGRATTNTAGYCFINYKLGAFAPDTDTITASVTQGGETATDQMSIYTIGGQFEVQLQPFFAPSDFGNPTTGDMVVLCDGSHESRGVEFIRLDGQPIGTTYQWEIVQGSAKASIYGSSTGQTVILKGTAKTDTVGEVQLRLTYTKNGHSCTSTRNLSVHKPSPAQSSRDVGPFEKYPGPPTWEWGRKVTYTIRSQHGVPLPEVYWDETITPISGDITLFTGGGNTDEVGAVVDNLFDTIINQPSNPWGDTSILNQQGQRIQISGCPEGFTFYRNRITSTLAPSMEVEFLANVPHP